MSRSIVEELGLLSQAGGPDFYIPSGRAAGAFISRVVRGLIRDGNGERALKLVYRSET
jgi:hypothetical protein